MIHCQNEQIFQSNPTEPKENINYTIAMKITINCAKVKKINRINRHNKAKMNEPLIEREMTRESLGMIPQKERSKPSSYDDEELLVRITSTRETERKEERKTGRAFNTHAR